MRIMSVLYKANALYKTPGRCKTRAGKRADRCVIYVWCKGDWRECVASGKSTQAMLKIFSEEIKFENIKIHENL